MNLPAPAAGAGQTVKLKACGVRAPQLFVNTAVAVQLALSFRLCSRELPDAPQPLHAQLPSKGCGPSTTREPVFNAADERTVHDEVPLTFM